ncbi:MAG: hypothetical protein IKZ49_04080 [Alphaproteobacteria bacterium]|nr:hypothetical protein [Alphaproteobacteria bacterium]
MKNKTDFYKFAPVAIICTIIGVSFHNKSCSNSSNKTPVKSEIKQIPQDTIQNYVKYIQGTRNGR